MDKKEHNKTRNFLGFSSSKRKSAYDKYTERSTRMLVDEITKNIKTAFIGALARFEDGFEQLFDNPAFLNRWKEVRTDILDLGNDQIELARQNIEENYHIESNKIHYTEFKLGKGKNNDSE